MTEEEKQFYPIFLRMTKAEQKRYLLLKLNPIFKEKKLKQEMNNKYFNGNTGVVKVEWGR